MALTDIDLSFGIVSVTVATYSGSCTMTRQAKRPLGRTILYLSCPHVGASDECLGIDVRDVVSSFGVRVFELKVSDDLLQSDGDALRKVVATYRWILAQGIESNSIDLVALGCVGNIAFQSIDAILFGDPPPANVVVLLPAGSNSNIESVQRFPTLNRRFEREDQDPTVLFESVSTVSQASDAVSALEGIGYRQVAC
jgi:hypothetical protein